MTKVIKDMVEYRTNADMKFETNIMQWLVRWAAMLMSRYKVGADGKRAMREEGAASA